MSKFCANFRRFNLAKRKLVITLFLLFVSTVQAQTLGQPLFFPADKNKIQILPQRFEYTLMDTEKIKLGDILIDASLIRFDVIKLKKTDNYALKFYWPAALLVEGEIIILDNNGKVILSIPLEKKKIEIINVENSENPELRSHLAQLISPPLDPELFESIKYMPYLKFCVSQRQGTTRVDLCSKELFLSSVKGQMTIKSRSSLRPQSKVSINGKDVGEQGMIFLNDTSQTIAFKAEVQSGATLEVETRKKEVDFQDVTMSEDQKNLIFEAAGAEPVIENQVERTGEGRWKTKVPVDRPVIYLKGEGGIPLRQEFFVRGTPPPSRFRIYAEPQAKIKTYSSQVKINGQFTDGVQIKNATKENSLRLVGKKEYSWTLNQLKTGENNRSYIQMTTPAGSWIAGYDIYRGYSSSIAVHADYLEPWSRGSGQLAFKYWFENFLAIDSSLTRHRWGLALLQKNTFLKKSDTPTYSLTEARLMMRLNQGLQRKDPSPNVFLSAAQLKLDSAAVSPIGFGGAFTTPSPLWVRPYFTNTQFEIEYLLATSTADLDFKGLFMAQALLEKDLSERLFAHVGLQIENISLPDSSNVKSFQWGFKFGMEYLF